MVSGAKAKGFSLYGGVDPADLPRYTRDDASRATNVPASTVGVWTHGMSYTDSQGRQQRYKPVIIPPDPDDLRLSFNNLLEVNVLRSLRRAEKVRLQDVRDAIVAAKKHGIDRLLMHPNLVSTGGELFLDYYFRLVELSKSKQLAMRTLLEDSLRRVTRDAENGLQFFPVPRHMSEEKRPILVSPYVSFGSAVIESRGISTLAIRSRVDAGEEKESVMADYDITDDEFEEAIIYENAA
jgi:uncharacterized protein (DUF433 family)